jgi:hypothetical protein
LGKITKSSKEIYPTKCFKLQYSSIYRFVEKPQPTGRRKENINKEAHNQKRDPIA